MRNPQPPIPTPPQAATGLSPGSHTSTAQTDHTTSLSHFKTRPWLPLAYWTMSKHFSITFVHGALNPKVMLLPARTAGPSSLGTFYSFFQRINLLGQPQWHSGLTPPAAQGMILETQDQVPRQAPHMKPASPSACVSASLSFSLSMCVSHE